MPSEYNLANLPSRKEYGIVESLPHAKWVATVIAKLYYDAKSVGVYAGVS